MEYEYQYLHFDLNLYLPECRILLVLVQRFAWELADSFVWEPSGETQLIIVLTMKNVNETFCVCQKINKV